MSQNFTDNCYIYTNLIAGVSSDLQRVEDNFTTLKTSFAGTSQPVTDGDYSVIAGLTWYDTTNLQLKYRNSANNGWLYYFPGDIDSKIWVYRNDAVEGMIVDSSVTDKVLALKGGSYDYNVNGGNTAGDWNIQHTHAAGSFTINNRHTHILDSSTYPAGGTSFSAWDNMGMTYEESTTTPIAGASATGGASSTWRPAAAVGVLLNPDL